MNKILILALLAMLFSSCSYKKDKRAYPVGKYLYLDAFNSLHLSKDCWRIGGNDVDFLDTASVYVKDEYKYCKDCFTDTAYEHVQAILHYDLDRKWLYEKLKETYSDIPDYREYRIKLHNPNKVRLLYDAACEQGWDVGSYEDFSKMIGFAK